MDRLSSLPEDALSHILSFLPTKTVVATSILSTSWKHRWTSVPLLDVDAKLLLKFHPFLNMNAYKKSEISVQNFVNRVMLLNGTPISKFRLIYEYQYSSAPIRTWLNVAISDKIQELELDFFSSAQSKVVHLPKKVFTSKMLVVLKLSRMPLNVPSVVSLPSLKILELKKIPHFHGNCIQNLLSGCQVLEELNIVEIVREKLKMIEISIPTLRSFCFSFKFVIDVMSDTYKFIINAPNLEHFDVKGRISDVFEVRNLSALNDATLDLGLPVFADDYNLCHQRIFHLLEGISNAESITLSDEIVQLLCEAFNQNLPRFSNLKQLTFVIGLDFGWKRMLVEFIKCSPNLDVLTLNNKHGFIRNMDELQKITPQPLPDNLLSHLKNILIDELYANFMPEYIEYLVQHVNILKSLKIMCRCPIVLKDQIDCTS